MVGFADEEGAETAVNVLDIRSEVDIEGTGPVVAATVVDGMGSSS